jgi:hypothetical protein
MPDKKEWVQRRHELERKIRKQKRRITDLEADNARMFAKICNGPKRVLEARQNVSRWENDKEHLNKQWSKEWHRAEGFREFWWMTMVLWISGFLGAIWMAQHVAGRL